MILNQAHGAVLQAMEYLAANSPVLAFRELQEADLLLAKVIDEEISEEGSVEASSDPA